MVEFSVSLPWDQKVRQGWSKFIIRRASEALLPGEVVWRRGWDDICWLFTSALIQKRSTWMVEQVWEQQALLRRYVDPKMLKYIVNNSKVVALSEYEGAIWSVFQLSKWLQFNARYRID